MRHITEYRRSIDEYKPVTPIKRKMKLYWALAAFRILLTLVPQTGYIHPDEYFQAIEVISGDRFDIDIYKPWEYNTTFPIRTIFIPQILVGTSYSFLKFLSPYGFNLFGTSLISPYYLIVFPRLFMCILSFVSDYCLYKICCMCGQNYKVRLITFASSYVMLTYATRVFSNSIELILTSLLLFYTSQCMVYSEKVIIQSDYLSNKYDQAKNGVERVKYYKLLGSLPSHSLNHCLKIATITVIGIFNRPTFVAFAFPPIFFWLQRGLGSRSIGLLHFHIRIFTFIICGIPTAIFFILVDSFYFGYLTMGEIGNFDISLNNFVVTPLNFLKYNSNPKNLENHGLHPRFLHFLLNIPLLYNVLGIIGLITFARMSFSGLKGKWLELPRIQSIVSLMTISFIVPVALLSCFPHQEPRFIIPVILPLVFLYAPKLSHVPGVDTVSHIKQNNPTKYKPDNKTHKLTKLQIIWYCSNIVLCLFYGFLHQGGVLSLTSHINTELKAKPHLTNVHLYTSYIYPIPTALLHLRNTHKTYISTGNHKYRLTKDFYLYEQGSKNLTEVYNSITKKLQECEEKFRFKRIPYRLYYTLPYSAIEEFAEYSQNNSLLFNYYTVWSFYPHISTEKLPSLKTINEHFNLQNISIFRPKSLMQLINDISIFFQQFKLALIKIENSTQLAKKTKNSVLT
ncbi:PREDICTED: GPI mannosyltransferase 4 [Polistes canadensis]|uniref:GPI mannosyltransferase 4 n=1 Tax=Polistes canadensis TaxID=91411 RepID=UPI000718FCB6|nr:PREDICTED: GPI mannosyltransferase 4 [Polistes canadensis]